MCGLCNQWQMEWSIDWNNDRMISQFYRGIDFYLKTRFVDRQFIKENFDIGLLRKNGILVDDTYSLINPEKVGCMTGTMIGMFASGNGTESDNYAAFDWFEIGPC